MGFLGFVLFFKGVKMIDSSTSLDSLVRELAIVEPSIIPDKIVRKIYSDLDLKNFLAELQARSIFVDVETKKETKISS